MEGNDTYGKYSKTAVIIASHNAKYFMQENIASIRETLETGTYHMYIVDNASTDGVAEWLEHQKQQYDDISVVCNKENVGFPKACNQGVQMAECEGDVESDIFLLNNDTRLCIRSLANLKDALYSSDDIGATGAVSNYAGNNQQLDVRFSLPSNYIEFGNNNNVIAEKSNKYKLWEERVRLTGFAMLIKRDVWNKAGGMDEAYSPGFIEDDDLSMKILMQNKKLIVCYNSFIYHAGSQNFSKISNVNELFENHYNYFVNKYGISTIDYVYPKKYYEKVLANNTIENPHILVIGSGIGADIKYIRSKVRNAVVYGIEKNESLRNVSSFTDSVYEFVKNICEIEKHFFDYVIVNKGGAESLNDDDFDSLDMVCSESCILIQENDVYFSPVIKDEEINEKENDGDDDHRRYDFKRRGADIVEYDALIMAVPNDYLRLEHLYPKLLATMPVRRVCFVGNEEVGKLVEKSGIKGLDYINENDILPFDTVHSVMKDALKGRLQGQELPRGITGWYYQQFLKMSYSKMCNDEYYLVWDGDTVPCTSFSMFNEEYGAPYLDLKTEYHEEYFNTISRILPGMGKIIEKSFVSEHMLMKREYMKELISAIESNQSLKGTTYFEKIIYSIDSEKLTSNSFSEFETYGTFVSLKHLNSYRLRNWHSFRYGGDFFDSKKISESDFEWLAKDFDAISFEKGHEVREDHKNLFDNKEYQEKLSARKMLEVAQEAFSDDSFKEYW